MFDKKLNIFGSLNDSKFHYKEQYALQERIQKYQTFIKDPSKALIILDPHAKSKYTIKKW